MIAHSKGFNETNNLVHYHFCFKTNIKPPGVKKQNPMGQYHENTFFAILTNLQVEYFKEAYRIDVSWI